MTMSNTLTIKNISPSGTQNLNFKINILTVEELLLCTQEKTIRNACKIGCTNYAKKWSCPPYSKKFSDIVASNNYDKVIIIMGYINLDDMSYISNPYQQVKAANMILKSKCEKVARNLEKEVGGYSLLSGSCNLCKPCQKKIGLPCKKPALMRYSLESTGIDVEAMLKRYCEHKLLWYKKGEKLPYTSVATAIIFNSNAVKEKNIKLLAEEYIEKLAEN